MRKYRAIATRVAEMIYDQYGDARAAWLTLSDGNVLRTPFAEYRAVKLDAVEESKRDQ